MTTKFCVTLKNSKTADWHAYTLKGEETHAFIAYGLENNPLEEEVKRDLLSKGIAVVNVYSVSQNWRHTLV
jgi:hypothetical protein